MDPMQNKQMSILQIKENMLFPASGVRLLQTKEVELFIKAKHELEENKKYLIKMADEAEKLYKSRYQEGYQDGREEGGFEHALKIFGTLFSSIKFVENIEKILLHVTMEAINKIIGEVTNTVSIESWIQKGLSELMVKYKIRLYVSTNDESLLLKFIDTLKVQKPDLIKFIQLITDENIKSGKCKLETELGFVEVNLKTLMKALEQSLEVDRGITDNSSN